MDMIGHQDIGMGGAARALSRVLHRGEVQALVRVTKENRLAIMAPWEDVVGNITEGGTGMPGHTRLLGLWLTLLSCELSLYYKRLLKNPTLTPIFTIQDLT